MPRWCRRRRIDWTKNLGRVRTRFVKRGEAELAQLLTESQKAAAILEPTIHQLEQTLKAGEADRPREQVARWQAGYDLAIGRAMAARVRTEAYNVMLAQAKQGMPFQEERHNTWTLQPSNTLRLGSQLSKNAEKAQRLPAARDRRSSRYSLGLSG